MQELFENYLATSHPVRMSSEKWAVSVTIQKGINGDFRSETFFANDKIHYILEVEAAKEGINLARNLIKTRQVGF